MRFITIPILILLVMTQTFSQWFVLLAFKINQSYIAKNICENRYRPQLHCNGNCVLMKKMKQRVKEEQKAPSSLKLEVSAGVLSSCSFFANLNNLSFTISKPLIPLFNTGYIVDRHSSVFHPPNA
jgi:hypothetical protein